MTAQPSGSGQELYYAGIAAVVIVILLALWMLFKPTQQPEPDIIVPVTVPGEVVNDPVLSVPDEEPVVDQVADTETEHEAESVVAVPVTEPEPLPPLEASDPVVKQDVLKFNWQPGLAGLINTQNMIRNLVVTIDNMAQKQLVAKHPVLVPLDQPLVTIADPENQTYQIDPASYQRYEPYIRLLESVDPQQMLPVFKRYQPLFEQVFGELGYPELSFKQRLQQALSAFLAIEPLSVDTTLVRKSVAYTYADPAVESLSDLEKQVIRLGPDNHQRLRAVAKKYLAVLETSE